MIEPLYVAARELLLDALDALGEQRGALILPAQAISYSQMPSPIIVPAIS